MVADRNTLERFGGYTLLESIGVGGMAEVFLARHSGVAGFEKDLVIKRIRPHLSEQPAFVNMFLGEAKLAAQLAHPNIVQIYDLGKIKDSFFIAMEYIAGRDLSAIIPKCKTTGIPFPVEYVLKVISSVCEALHYAHTKTDAFGSPLHIVHRDISPENIRVAWTGAVKILDFGIAKAATHLHETRAGEIKGKLSYMSPEQVMGRDLDSRSDLFSLGIVAYEALTALKLFSGDNDLTIMHNIVEGKIYPPSYFRDDVQPEVEQIIMKALEKDRKRRYQTASDMQFDIDSFLASHEFTPSNIHLSNFLKQLYKEELEAEQERRMRETPPDASRFAVQRASESNPGLGVSPMHAEPSQRRKPPPPPGTDEASEDAAEVDIDAIEVETTGRSILVSFEDGELERLNRLAERQKMKPAELICDIVRHYLKYSA